MYFICTQHSDQIMRSASFATVIFGFGNENLVPCFIFDVVFLMNSLLPLQPLWMYLYDSNHLYKVFMIRFGIISVHVAGSKWIPMYNPVEQNTI